MKINDDMYLGKSGYSKLDETANSLIKAYVAEFDLLEEFGVKPQCNEISLSVLLNIIITREAQCVWSRVALLNEALGNPSIREQIEKKKPFSDVSEVICFVKGIES